LNFDPVEHALAQGPAREFVADIRQAGWPVAIPVGIAALTHAPGLPSVALLGVETTPRDALAPLFPMAGGKWTLENIFWAVSLGDNLEAAYAYLVAETDVAEVSRFFLVIEEVHMWRGFLFDEPRPSTLLLAKGDDPKVISVLRDHQPPGTLSEGDLIVLPNPPLPAFGFGAASD
jgi:hypothetical protein